MHKLALRARQTAWAVLPMTLRMTPDELSCVLASSQMILTGMSRRLDALRSPLVRARERNLASPVRLAAQW